MSLELLAIIFSSVSIVANLYIMRHWIVCWFKGHEQVNLMRHDYNDGHQYVLPPRCRRCGL